ncbi:hypothetical protein FRX31_016146 [Thalictrum thalictroides]|uniref:Uncharacterized protein n=1 Tax=Thalictrum thalictroides TaxID=46969 RepID=A0A7J6WBE1_THATH|nr:hypothetical protein FRX31_016146 [Thalictrum thalictroides]
MGRFGLRVKRGRHEYDPFRKHVKLGQHKYDLRVTRPDTSDTQYGKQVLQIFINQISKSMEKSKILIM